MEGNAYGTARYPGGVALNGFSDMPFQGVGQNGRYAIKARENGMVAVLKATATLNFQGKAWEIDLWPTDNLPNGADIGDYRGSIAKGVVRDFVFRQSGLRPGYRANDYPGYSINEDSRGASHYGATLSISTGPNSDPLFKYSKASVVRITLIPCGPMLDGTAGKSIRRSTPLAVSMDLYGIPVGTYTLTAQLTEPSIP